MDQYAAALGDDRRTLKDVAPLAEGLGQAAGQLSRLSQGLKEGNPLKGLSNEAAVAATVEYMKFQRGDYVA
jgi:X-X-X-Leu-X-X-Gly heptad repeat protein